MISHSHSKRPATAFRSEPLEPRALLATFTVTTTADAGPGSLRQAILDANAAPGADVIRFTIQGPGPVHSIRPLSPLPEVTDPTTLDATTQAGYAGSPLIELDGSAAGQAADGLVITFRPSTVRGLAINRFGGNGVVTRGAPTDVRPPPRMVIQANHIGTDAGGSVAMPNGGAGVLVAAAFTEVSGGNVISGNGGAGVLVTVPVPIRPFSEVHVRDNRIGTDAAGTAAIGNGREGIEVADGAAVWAMLSGNLISGNSASGVRVGRLPTGSVHHVGIRANRIGTDNAGTRPLPNGTGVGARGRDGVTCAAGSIIDISQRNIISGNRGNGITVSEGASAGISGNYIGTDAAGNAALGNGGHGIFMLAPARAGFFGNVISANGGDGARLERVAADPSGSVHGNRIGTSAAGNAPLGNVGNGLVLDRCRDIVLRHPPEFGTFMSARNVISANGGHGVLILGDRAQRPPSGIRIGHVNIGTSGDEVGRVDMGNGGDGVHIAGAVGVRVAGAVISANRGNGVTITDLAGAPTATLIESNTIAGNRGHGVAVVNSSGNRIGGPLPPADGSGSSLGNIISANARAGVRVEGDASQRNRIEGNSIDNNGELGIDLGPAGVTPNDRFDADAGPNGLQNFPVIESVVLGAPILTVPTAAGHNRVTVRLALHARPLTGYRIDLYWSPQADPLGYGEGGNAVVSVGLTTDAAGNGTAVADLPRNGRFAPYSGYLGGYFTATAVSGETSEFSPPVRVWPDAAAVVARHIFYNNSAYDGRDPAANAADDAAIDTKHWVALPGHHGTPFTYTNVHKGINGIMIDVANLPADRTLTADDFEFHAGNSPYPRGWSAAPRPTVTVRRGAGVAGSDRVTLIWADGAIVNKWLRVRLNLPSENPAYRREVFYAGNLVGDTVPPHWGVGESVVESADVERAASFVGRTGVPASRYSLADNCDVNADGRVDALDVAIVRANVGNRLAGFFAPRHDGPQQMPPARRSGYLPPPAATATGLVCAARDE